MRISDWSSDVCSSDLAAAAQLELGILRDLQVERRERAGLVALVDLGQAAAHRRRDAKGRVAHAQRLEEIEIGRASCRERVCPYVSISVVAVSLKKKKNTKC